MAHCKDSALFSWVVVVADTIPPKCSKVNARTNQLILRRNLRQNLEIVGKLITQNSDLWKDNNLFNPSARKDVKSHGFKSSCGCHSKDFVRSALDKLSEFRQK